MKKRVLSLFVMFVFLSSIVSAVKEVDSKEAMPSDPAALSDQMDKAVEELKQTDAEIESARAELEKLNNLMQKVLDEPDSLTEEQARLKYPGLFEGSGPMGASGPSGAVVSAADLAVCSKPSRVSGFAVADIPCSKAASQGFIYDSEVECKKGCSAPCVSSPLGRVVRPEVKDAPLSKTCWKCAAEQKNVVVNVNVCINIKIIIIKKITIKINILLVKIKVLIQKRINIYIRIINIKILIIKICFKRPTETVCPPRTVERPMTGVPVTQPREGLRIPNLLTPRPVTETACSCPEGTSTQGPDPNLILEELQRYRCVSGASIKVGGSRQGNCPPCYGRPQISVNPTPPVCRGTPCGDVACDGSAQCACPDKPNCVLTVRCTWGGWKYAGQNQFVPVVGAG
ncbi:hypothetical protein HY489_03530 [Candidatus Woesearchaeota archaeon]|nr:hypothetical protein [Candidatus Woesearchaeota archaeon]